MKILFIIIFLLFNLVTHFSKAQSDSLYHIEISTAISPLISVFKDERYPGAPKNASMGYGMSVRAMWHPGRLLAFGVMSGYLLIVKDEFQVNSVLDDDLDNQVTAKLNAIPLQIVVSMQKRGLEFGLGMGPYILLSTIEYGKPAHSHRFELGLTLLGVYNFSIDKNISIGSELRIFYLSYRGILSVMPSVSMRYEIWSY
jgi:hypothetical protein